MLGTGRKRILLVEDEAIIAMAERATLEGYGYGVSILASGEAALAFFEGGGGADLVLMDIDLGSGMDGTRAAEAILEIRDLPIVFLSSHTEPEVVKKTEGITSYGYVVKSSVGTVLDASIKMAFKLFEANSLLGASEAKHRALIGNISDVIGIVGADGLIKYLSPNIEGLFGWRPEEVLGGEAWFTVSPKDVERVKTVLLGLLEKDGSSATLEFDYLPKGGEARPVKLTAINLAKNPHIAGILINYHDITERRRAEAALRESEYCLSRAEKAAGIGNWKITLSTMEISGSEGARLVYGLDRDRMDLASVQGLVLPEYRKQGDDALRNLVELGAAYDIEAKIRRPLDGAIVDIHSMAEYDRTEGVLYGVVQDITERRLAEEKLRLSEERLRNVMAGTSAGTWEWNIQTGAATVDDTSLGFLGYGQEDLAPLDFAKWMNLKHPRDMLVSEEQLRRHIEGETDFYSSESRMRHKDGNWIWILGRGKLIERDKEGRPLKMFGIHLDINERMEAEVALRESESRLSRAEEIAGIGNWKLVLGTGEMEFSKGMARIFGQSSGLVSRETARAIDLPEYHEALDEALRDLVERGIPYNIEFKIKRPSDGAIVDIHSMADYDGENGIVFGVVQDVTERRRAEKEIRDLLAEKELILREVQHRIKNNMATMVSLLSLQAGVVKDEVAAMALKDAESRLRSMGVLYDKLYRSEALREMSIRDYLPALVEEIVAEFPISSKVRIETMVEDFPFGVREMSTLGILVNEVVTNSMKYAFVGRPEGLIRVDARREGGTTRIVIADDGIGLPQRVDIESPESFGLLLVQSLARQLGARLEVDSGAGTRVGLTIEDQ